MPLFHTKRPPVGAMPGTLVIAEEASRPRINLLTYSTTGVQESQIQDVSELAPIVEGRQVGGLLEQLQAPKAIHWIDVQGLGDVDVLRAVAKLFQLHHLTIADVVNVGQRPKLEEHDDYLLILAMMAHPTLHRGKLDLEQVSFIIGRNYVATFQERHGDIFDPVRQRIRDGKGPIRKSGSDYLGYALLDAVVDGYFPVLEQVGERLELLENEVITYPSESTLQDIYRNKRELLRLRRAVWPLREALNELSREGTPQVRKSTRPYFRDTYGHLIEVIDMLEGYREIAGSFMDIYLSSLSNRMNEVMKVLTIIATIFIPLSFLAGIYGMNFENMPELKYRWAYPLFWLVIISIAGGLLWFFRAKGWLGTTEPVPSTAEERSNLEASSK